MHLYPCVHVCVYVCMFICTVQSFYYMRVRVYGGIGSKKVDDVKLEIQTLFPQY